VRTKLKVLLAAGTVALACAATAGAVAPPGANYPWVQLPAWVGSGITGTLPTAAQPGVQLPASIPPTALVRAPAIAGSSYQWVQLPAWVGTSGIRMTLPTASYPWTQPPAWVPIQ
jgi:hypothetical protein